MPPPNCTGISSPITLTTSRIASSFRGRPATAPFRSTRCRRSAPSSSQWRAIAAGSSENTVADCMSPCLRRTQCPSLISIAGMICMAAGIALAARRGKRRGRLALRGTVPGDEIREQAQSRALALFRVELDGEDISPRYGASKRRRVRGGACRQRRVFGHRIVAMREVEALAVGDARPQRMFARARDGTPSHVRNLEPLASGEAQVFFMKASHSAGDDAEAARRPFLALVEEHLQAEAHPEERSIAQAFEHDPAQARGIDARHRV